MNEPQQKQQLRMATLAKSNLLDDLSIEATALQIEKIGVLSNVVPKDAAVFIANLLGANYAESFVAVERLASAGLTPIPHIAARAIKSIVELDET